MKLPTTYEVNTPRALVKYLTDLVAEVNDNSDMLAGEKEKRLREKEAIEAKASAEREKFRKKEAKEEAKNAAIAEAKRVIARAEAREKAEEQARIRAKEQEKALRDAKKLLGIKETANEKT